MLGGWKAQRGITEIQTALVKPDESKVTYSQLNSLVNRIGNILKVRFGIKENDVICTLIGDDDFHIALIFATVKVGAAIAPLNRSQEVV